MVGCKDDNALFENTTKNQGLIFNMKEIIVFSCGDSRDISTWSNVPYLFTKTLEEKGIKVNRVDISPSKLINRLFNTCSYIFCKRLLHLKVCPEFHRTFFHRFIIYRRIKKATVQYPNSELNLFLSFAFLNPYSNKPNVLWCDWTDAIAIERLGRKPMWHERLSLKHEHRVMQRADLVFSMFPKCAQQMQTMYGREVLYLKQNVVNTVWKQAFELEEVIKNRQASHQILFIGSHLYKSGALKLIHAFLQLKSSDPDLSLHIVGMTQEELPAVADLYCYGYLHKDIPDERDKYYDLLTHCVCFVNPTAQWGGYSSCIEAMYYASPIVVSPYDDFVEEFGRKIDFGFYCHEDDLVQQISRVLYAEQYVDLCQSAHERVKDYTWSNYVDLFLAELDSRNLNVTRDEHV